MSEYQVLIVDQVGEVLSASPTFEAAEQEAERQARELLRGHASGQAAELYVGGAGYVCLHSVVDRDDL